MTTGSTGNRTARLALARWALVPVTVVLFALVGLALSTEDRSDFQARQVTPMTLTEPDLGDLDPSRDPSTAPAPDRPPATAEAPGASDPTGSTAEGQPTESLDDQAGGDTDDRADSGPGDEGGIEVIAELVSAAGRIGLEFGGGDPLVRPVGADGTVGLVSELVDGPNGPSLGVANPAAALPGADGFRLTTDGRLDPVPTGDIAAGDLVIAPTGSGVDVLRADGSRVELRPWLDGMSPAVSVTDVGADGTRTPLDTGGEAEIPIGDGVTVRVPNSAGGTGGEPPTSNPTGRPWWLWLAAGLVIVALAGTLLALVRQRRQTGTPGPSWVGSGSVPPHRFEELVTILAADPDPDRAIRLAFAAAERGFGTLPRRNTSETPFEWYRRASIEQPALADHLSGLCAAFANTRFTPDPSTLAERDAALANLRQLHRLANDPRAGNVPRADRPGPDSGDTRPGPRNLSRVGGGG